MKMLLRTKSSLMLTTMVAIGALCCGSPLALAAENENSTAVATGQELKRAAEDEPASTEEDQEDEDLPVLDSSREEVREATEWVARGVDSWFGNKPFEEGGKVTKGRIRTRVVWREHDEVDFNLRFRVSMRLPNLQDKAYVLIGSENERDMVRDRPDTVMDQQRLLR